MPSVAERLAEARARLETSGLRPSDAAFDAEVLARHALGWDRATLVARGREAEPAEFPSAFLPLVARRASREPVAQITGHREFWERDFIVTPDVLIPRPETEIIVEEALAFARQHPCRRVADVGTGSGCLAVTIACELPDVMVAAVDSSDRALAVARRNAMKHGVEHRVLFHRGDLLQPLTERQDLIVSNPPYVPNADARAMAPEVLEHEPHLALFGGPTGLEVIERLLASAADHLAPGGRLVVEFGFGQHPDAQSLAEAAGWTIVRMRDDLQGIPRTIVLTR